MKIFNSLSENLEEFTPLKPGRVTMYVCGITPYDTTHLGHAYTYIFFDALQRYLKFKGFEVIYTQNVTDINDRDKDILEKAREQRISWKKLADFWTKKFLEDMKALNWIKPKNYLFASKEIASMIKLIKELLKKGLAYQVNSSVYLDISKFKIFGKLSGLNKNQMLKKAKDFEEDINNPNKRHSLDITLWRATQPNQPVHIPSFKSPFGPGRPGWHIECSAMSTKTLGDQIDIHGGGIDLIFPHHEAEVVQSEGATGKIPFVKYWIHTSQVFYQGQKMSKSKGNLVLVSDLLKKYSQNAIRWLLLSHHFCKNWEYKESDLKKAQAKVNSIEKKLASPVVVWERNTIAPHFLDALEDNLNTPKALEILSEKPSKKMYRLLGFSLTRRGLGA